MIASFILFWLSW